MLQRLEINEQKQEWHKTQRININQLLLKSEVYGNKTNIRWNPFLQLLVCNVLNCI